MKPLSEDLKYWRAERPDEWTMDEFIREAAKLEARVAELTAELDAVRGNYHALAKIVRRCANVEDSDTTHVLEVALQLEAELQTAKAQIAMDAGGKEYSVYFCSNPAQPLRMLLEGYAKNGGK